MKYGINNLYWIRELFSRLSLLTILIVNQECVYIPEEQCHVADHYHHDGKYNYVCHDYDIDLDYPDLDIDH
jgi:hypothetical protein